MSPPRVLYTTFGPLSRERFGMILPHEHVYVDFRSPDDPQHGKGPAEDVVRKMAPEIEKLKPLGVTALVDCTPVGVGRRADALLALSQATNFPIISPTGIYREPAIPRWAREATEAKLEA